MLKSKWQNLHKSKGESTLKRQKKTLRERAEEVAVFNLNDDYETWPMLLFRFDDTERSGHY